MRVRGFGVGLWLVLALGACGGDEEVSVSTNSSVYCAGYTNACGANDCVRDCGGGVMPSTFAPRCAIYACGAATGTCEGDEPGDRGLLSCAQDQGWTIACQQLNLQCSSCAPNAPARCATVPNAGNNAACINMLAAIDGSADGCTDPTP